MSRCPKQSRFESDSGKARERRAVYRDFSCSRCCRRNTQLNCGAGRIQCNRPDGSDFSCEASQSDRRRAVAHGQQLQFLGRPKHDRQRRCRWRQRNMVECGHGHRRRGDQPFLGLFRNRCGHPKFVRHRESRQIDSLRHRGLHKVEQLLCCVGLLNYRIVVEFALVHG